MHKICSFRYRKDILRMSHRSRASKVRQHLHCDSCYSRRCRARVEVSVSCALVPCRLLCGAVFHLCKEEDHLLLCPNVRVPCLNGEYGCPVQLPRSSQKAHLQVCPASVVCCSMEWNRWPVTTCSQPNTELFENLLREQKQEECLDLAMALKDQDALFHSMKMKKLFPELIQSVEEEEREEQRQEEERRKEKEKKKSVLLEKEAAERAASKEARDKIWEAVNRINVNFPDEKQEEDEYEYEAGVESQPMLSQEEREAIARASGVDADLLVNYNAWERMFSMEMGGCREAEGTAAADRGQGRGVGKSLGTLKEEDETGSCAGAAATSSSACSVPSTSSCRTGKPRMKNFVYGKVEPMKIMTVRTFKVPSSFTARQGRIRNPGFYKRENEAVDTSDLGVAPGEMPVWEEVQASLLCSLEREQRGHLIAESMSSDSLLTDQGTQTYSFLSAPFRRKTSLADLTAGKPLELHLQLQLESVTSRHNKASSAFTFLCGHTFQRTEYGKHYKNIHSDIQMGVDGWFEQRCPLAYLGCTYTQRRFRPSTYEATVSFNEELGCFSLHPTAASSQTRGGGQAEGGEDSLSVLPYEERGMVTLHWERSSSSQGRVNWKVTHKVWQFSSLFSPVDSWGFRNIPSISEHLKVCHYNEVERKTEKMCLPRAQEEIQSNKSCKGPTLVTVFQEKRILM
ncbi:F-box only protein 40-like isoform X2 [Girardinichthys multiradiatus]|uniref:F-box only protein 40-like isoform X2 n=1 Tax=Girardinichthys multiradiatus TaxID=208333 RepID=UPI001FAC411E|nr:F-box only protein 40-like isoform X2 [Girardinichthys multiradiatus]